MPRKVTELADFTHKSCAGCKALRMHGGSPSCGLGFEVISYPWPGKSHVKIIRPCESCFRPKTLKSYYMCRTVALELGKSVEKRLPASIGTIATTPKNFHLGYPTEKVSGPTNKLP